MLSFIGNITCGTSVQLFPGGSIAPGTLPGLYFLLPKDILLALIALHSRLIQDRDGLARMQVLKRRFLMTLVRCEGANVRRRPRRHNCRVHNARVHEG